MFRDEKGVRGSVDSALIVAHGEKGRMFLSELLKGCGVNVLSSALNGSDARRMLLETPFDLVVVNTPLPDEFGTELAVSIAERGSGTGVILLARSEIADSVSSKVEDYGVFVVEKPLSRQLFFQSVKLLAASGRRMSGLKREYVQLQNKIEEMRLVDRAKCALIQYLGMTEAQAHRYLEKQAMDMRKSKLEVAEGILRTYETYDSQRGDYQ